MIQDGDKAPDFELPTESGEAIKLSRLKGRPVVVYFYPKDDTSGCTAEARISPAWPLTSRRPEWR
jgi:peroxiredoxin Q/BCP